MERKVMPRLKTPGATVVKEQLAHDTGGVPQTTCRESCLHCLR
jgi:hypothetical protein